MDKSGIIFVLVLLALAAIVVSVLLIEAERTVTPQADDGSLILPSNLDQAR